VGPGFASYYPERSSVFGFWDTFSGIPTLEKEIASNAPIQFPVYYQVIGWINEREYDPLNGITDLVTGQYNDYVAQQTKLNLPITETPADFFVSVAKSISASWVFEAKDIPYSLDPVKKTIVSLTVPTGTLCSGVVQEVVWNML